MSKPSILVSIDNIPLEVPVEPAVFCFNASSISSSAISSAFFPAKAELA
jgi:hypothetical protein